MSNISLLQRIRDELEATPTANINEEHSVVNPANIGTGPTPDPFHYVEIIVSPRDGAYTEEQLNVFTEGLFMSLEKATTKYVPVAGRQAGRVDTVRLGMYEFRETVIEGQIKYEHRLLDPELAGKFDCEGMVEGRREETLSDNYERLIRVIIGPDARFQSQRTTEGTPWLNSHTSEIAINLGNLDKMQEKASPQPTK
ncbi:hypothetical protein ACFL1B_02000 [Nanoarchaeota archaeon]